MSQNPFDLLDDLAASETVESPLVSVSVAPAVVSHAKPSAENAGPRGKRHHNSDFQKNTPVKAPPSSEHAPARLVYSREWLLSCYKNYAAPAGFQSGASAFHELSQLPVALLPHTHEHDDQEERGYGYHKGGRGGRGQQQGDRRQNSSDRDGNMRSNPRDRLDRSGGGRNTGFQARGTQQTFDGHHAGGGASHSHAQDQNRRSGSHHVGGATGASSTQTFTKFEEKPAGDQSWLFEGGDDALMGSLDDVAGRFGITTDEAPSGVPGSSLEAYDQHSRMNNHQQPTSRANTEDWRKKDPSTFSRPSVAPSHTAAPRSNALNTSEEVMKPRAARHTIQPTSAAPAAIPRASSPVGAPIPSSSPSTVAATLDALWWYLDSKNTVQGPFSGSKMNSWLNFFTPDLQVGNSPTGPWSPLADRVVGGINPFDGLSLATSPHNDFKSKLQEYRNRYSQIHSHTTPQKPQQPHQTHQAPNTPHQGSHPAQTHHEVQNLFQTAPAASPAHNPHAMHPHAQSGASQGMPNMMSHMGVAQHPQQHHASIPAPTTPVKGNALRLDDLFGSAGNMGGMTAMQASSGSHAPNSIWAPKTTQPSASGAPSFRQIQEQEAMARAAALATAPATTNAATQFFAPTHSQSAASHASASNAAPHTQTAGAPSKVADSHSLFSMHFGSGASMSSSNSATTTSSGETSRATQSAVAKPADAVVTVTPTVVASPASNINAHQASESSASASSAPRTTPAASKTSVNDLFDSARAGRSVPPAVVVPKGPGMYEIQQEELRRAAEEKAAEAKRKEEAKKAHEAQRGMWAESSTKVVASAPVTSSSSKSAKSMREIQEEQERELSAQRQRQADQRAAAAATTTVRAPTFNGAWGSATGGATKSLKQIQEEEARAIAAQHAAAAADRPVPTTPVAKKSSWAATVSPTAVSLRQIAAESQAPVQGQNASAPHKSPAKPVSSSDDADSFWDYPSGTSEKEFPQAAPKVPIGGVPKAGKKKGQKKVLNI